MNKSYDKTPQSATLADQLCSPADGDVYSAILAGTGDPKELSIESIAEYALRLEALGLNIDAIVSAFAILSAKLFVNVGPGQLAQVEAELYEARVRRSDTTVVLTDIAECSDCDESEAA